MIFALFSCGFFGFLMVLLGFCFILLWFLLFFDCFWFLGERVFLALALLIVFGFCFSIAFAFWEKECSFNEYVETAVSDDEKPPRALVFNEVSE